jgi:ankyrin repeat protein
MSDAFPLPARPNLEQYKKLAKDFQAVCKSGDDSGVRVWARTWAETLVRLRGPADTPEVLSEIRSDVERVARQWRAFRTSTEKVTSSTLAAAQLFIARCHGFTSWPRFTEHIQELERPHSPVSQFESAVEAIVGGDAATLNRLLQANPELVRMRSTREHRSMLLHYVSANGVEDFRQKTPKNIVEITKMLLEAGADVNAESEAYGGRATTLGLAATSYHPQAAGVQLDLMDVLIRHGATIDHADGSSAVNGCLHNGRGEAAEFFANRGARLDLEGAAGVGRLDMLRKFFNEDGSLRPPATPRQMRDGFAWACEFGRTESVDFLLRHGMDVNANLPHDGQTGLHWAACMGHADTVKLLLGSGANAGAKDQSYQGTPLEWALYGWGGKSEDQGKGYREVVTMLARAGAKLDSEWFEGDDEDRLRAIRKLRSDRGMQAALRGET